MKNAFDALDYQLIQLLKQNARASASELARLLSANERTIRKRIDRLIKYQAVKLTAIVDPDSFDYLTTVDIFLEAELDQEEAILKQLLEFNEIAYLAYGQGSQDISIQARFKDNDQMREFLRKRLAGIPGLTVKGYAIVPRILRNIDEWMPRPDDFTSGYSE